MVLISQQRSVRIDDKSEKVLETMEAPFELSDISPPSSIPCDICRSRIVWDGLYDHGT